MSTPDHPQFCYLNHAWPILLAHELLFDVRRLCSGCRDQSLPPRKGIPMFSVARFRLYRLSGFSRLSSFWFAL